MNVKLVSITKSLVEAKELSAEGLIVYIARVSNPSNQLNTETADKLLGYMIKNKHWSPFDMVNMTVEVTTSKAIGTNRQSSNERIGVIQVRDKSVQSEVVDEHMDVFNDLMERIAGNVKQTTLLYKEALTLGVAKECARMILPMASSTTMYLNGSVRSWIHYLEQRTDLHAQLEHRQVAAEILVLFKTHFPNIVKALGYAD